MLIAGLMPGLGLIAVTGAVAAPPPRPNVLFLFADDQRSIRDERWKLIRYPQINKTQLFDLQTDPAEIHNLADDPAHAQRIARLLENLAARQKSMGDKLSLTTDNPQPAAWTPPKVPIQK